MATPSQILLISSKIENYQDQYLSQADIESSAVLKRTMITTRQKIDTVDAHRHLRVDVSSTGSSRSRGVTAGIDYSLFTFD
jgi:hypothetical protein